MLKNFLMTAAAALAITAGAITLSTSDANARGRVNINPSGGDVGRGYPGGGDNIQPSTFHGRFSCRNVLKQRYGPRHYGHSHKHSIWVWQKICY